jgi:anti-sigma factor RsiW
MSAVEHDCAQLGAHVLGALEMDEAAEFETHLISCCECRAEVAELSLLRDELDEVPPEAFLDGPPAGGDVLLQRTLRAVRAAEPRRPSRVLAVAGVAAIAVITLGVGGFIGRQIGADSGARDVAVPPYPTATAPSTVPVGVRNIEATDPRTGVRMVAAVMPAAGWVRVHIAVQGVGNGEKCQLLVVSKQGQSVVAGSWMVSDKGQHEGVALDGSALVAPDDVASVEVVTVDGRKLVSASV